MENKRAAERRRVFKGATIQFNGGAIDCVVRNLSKKGAALEVASPLGIPSEFNLIVTTDRTFRRCRVVHRKEKRIGVMFD